MADRKNTYDPIQNGGHEDHRVSSAKNCWKT